MYELNGKSISLEQLQSLADENGVRLEDLISSFKTQGLVEKTNGSQIEDATVEPTDMASNSEDTSWGSRLYNNFQAYVNPFVPMEDKIAYAAGVNVKELEEKVRVQNKDYQNQVQDFNKELDKAFGPNGELFGKVIENPNNLSLEDRKQKAGEFGTPEEYLLDLIKQQVGGMGWFNEKTELGEAKYGLLNQDDIEAIVKDKFNIELEQYLENKANNFAISKAQEIGDGKIRDWQEENRSTLINAYQGINKEIASLVEKLNYGNLEGEERTAVYQELLQKKQEKGEGTSMLFDLNTRKLVIARDKKDAEQKINENENLIDLSIEEEQVRINEKLGLLDADDQLDYLRNEFETSALTYAGHQKYLNQGVQIEVAVPGSSEEGFQGDETEIRTVPLRQILQEELGTNWVTKSLKGLKLEDRVDVKVLEGLTTPEGKVLKSRDDIEDFIQILANNELDYTREYNATKNMYLLNEGLVDLEKPEYVPSTIIPKNMAALKQAGKSLMRPWSGEYYADKIIGSTGRDKIIATSEVYDNLGIKKTEEEQEQLEVNLREMVNDGLLQSNKMLVEFAGINKSLAAAGATARFARLMQALEKGKYVKDGTRYSNAAIKARARARNMEVSDYAKMVGLRETASIGNRGLQIMANGLMEGLKFEAFTQFDITNMQLKPEAGEQFGFATGFGFGAAGRVLTPLSPLLQRKGYLKDIDGNLLKYAPTARQARIGLNSRKLFETFVTAPASFVAGSEGGELVNMLVEDAMGDASFNNYLDEHYGHHDEVGKRLISNYFIGLGFGVGHFKGFADYKSKAALERVANKELNILRNEFGGLAKLTPTEKNNIFSKESIKKLHKNLSDENLSRFYKHYEIYEMAYNRRRAAIRAEGYMDPSRAEELVRQDHKKLVAEERAAGRTIRFEVVNNNKLKPFQKKMTDKAQIIDSPDGKGKTIRYNADFYTPDVLAHEIHHYYTEDLLGRDVVFKADFMNNLNSIASKIELGRLVTEVEAKELGNEARAGQRMNLSEAIKLEKFDLTNPRRNTKISQWELFAHIAEQLGNKNNYLNVKNSNGFSDLKSLLSSLAKPTGKKLNLSREADVVRWFAEYASNVKKGKSVVDLFAELNSVVDKYAIKINQRQALLDQPPGSTRLSSRDLIAERDALKEANKKLVAEKPEGYLEQAKRNNEELKKINENIRVSEANEKNIKTYLELEAGDPLRTRAENELIRDNVGIIEKFISSEFDSGKQVSAEDFRAGTYAQVTKAMNRYDATTGVPFGAYLRQSLGGKHTGLRHSQQGNILKAAQKGKPDFIRTEAEMGTDFDLTRAMNEGSLQTGGLKTVEAGGKKGKRVEDTFEWTESDVAEKIDRAVVEKNIDVEGYVYKDIKKEVAGVELVERVDKKTGKTKMVRPTKAADVKATGGLVDVLEIVSKEFGISDVNRVLADQTLTTKMRDAARNYIYKHRKASQESMPEAETVSGVATGIYNTNLKPMYVEVVKRGKVSEGRTAAGKAVVEKRTDFTEADYLALFNIRPDGTFIPFAEGRSLSQVDATIREAIKQTAVIATNQSIRKQYPGKYAVLGAGRAEAMASKMLDMFMERFPENTFEQASEKFYRAYLNDTKNITVEELQYLKNMELEPGLMTREAALLFGYAEAKGKAGKAKQKGFDKDIIDADIKPVSTADGKVITPAEIKGLDLSANFSKSKGNVLVNVPRTNRFVDHSVEFSKLLPKEIAQNLSFLDQILFLHQRTTFEGEGRYAKFAPAIDAITGKKVRQIEGEFEGFIMDSRDGSPIVEQPFTRGRERALEVLGENTLSEIWEGVGFEFNKAESQVTGQKNYIKAKTNAERIAVVEKYFSQLSESNKAKIYDGIASTMEAYVHSGKTKAEVLSRMEWAANAMRSNSDLRLGLRQTAPILAIYKGKGKMTDAKFKLEHLKTSKKQSSTAFELIAQNKWRQFGPETLKDFVGVLSPKKLLDIIDAKGGKVNAEALYRMALLEPNTLKEFVTVESKGKENLLDYVLRTVKSNVDVKAAREATLQEMMLKENDVKIKQNVGPKYKSQGLYLSSKNLSNIDNALIEGRKRNKNPRGMSTFDFDETLIIGGKNFVTATKGKESIRISSEQFPLKGPELAEQGYKFDFKDFVNVKGGKEGPLMQKLKNQIEKYGTENVFILTARMQEAAPAIQAWLKTQGVNLPLKNITGLGNSTGEAKALWMLEKFSEGYNDMYFVDDALPNVKAVRNVLNQLDIKSKVQQALASVDLNKGVNDIMQYSLGIKSNKVFSKAEGKVRGKDIKRRRFFMPDTAADLELLLEPLYGKGEKGIENKKWFQENFVRKWERGINDFNNARQTITNDYMSLRKKNKDVVKQLSEAVEGTNFTHDQAIRIYIWNKNGYKIPDLAPTTQQKLVKYVANNPKYKSYADNLARLTKVEGGLKEPSAEWWAETIATEIKSLGEGIGRKKYIQDFIDSKNEIFSEANLNKMESKLGSNWRETIEDMFDRMETGRTRSMNLGKTGTAIMNYLNGSTGAIMNFNTRSAMLQLISTVNFVNSSFNNPLRAGQAFANQPQYWKDFMFIMNSDMLKQRRQGLEINVSEAELASAASQSKNPARAALAKILKAGYIPTKIADSFAIAAGGATYYRNAIRKYTKEGLSKAEAERRAFIDFQAIAERSQQSSRADLLSKQQTSLEGRLILPFANTPMQMNRIMIKEILDLSKGRYKGFYGENSLTSKMSRIGYYGFVQSLIFAGLQSGAFALMTNSDDDKKKAESKLSMLNTVADSFLRGMGIQGAVVNGVRLSIQEFIKQDGKKYNADYSEVAEKLLNISPTVGSKFSKLDAAGNTYKYNKKVIKEEGLTLNGPLLEAGTQVIEATTNAPLNRYYKKGNNIQNALDDSYYNWQRVLSASGWSVWGLGEGKDEERLRIINKGKDSEYRKYLTKEALRREQVEKEVKEKNKVGKNQCGAIVKGRRCKNQVNKPKTRCHFHD